MIPALLAAPMVEGVVGGVIGGVMNCFAPSQPTAPAPVSATSFGTSLNRAASAATPTFAPISPSGIMRASEWNQLGSSDIQAWAKGLTGRHVDATDSSGRTISGVVSAMQLVGGTPTLEIGGHFVSLSQLKQISWSPSVA